MNTTELLSIFNAFTEDRLISLVVKVAIILSVVTYIIRSLIIPTLREIIDFKNDDGDNKKRKEINNSQSYVVQSFTNITNITYNHFSIFNTKD